MPKTPTTPSIAIDELEWIHEQAARERRSYLPDEVEFKNPISDATRKERRNLLVCSALGLALVYTGLLPNKISALGLEFTIKNSAALLEVLAVIVIYLNTAFFIYGFFDYISWRAVATRNRVDKGSVLEQKVTIFAFGRKPLYRNQNGELETRALTLARDLMFIFEYILPICLGTSTVFALLHRASVLKAGE